MDWSVDDVLGSMSEAEERPVSPWGNKMPLPWAWQMHVEPVRKTATGTGEGLDDADEFISDEDVWRITLSNKNQPGKQLVGTAQWLNGQNPRVLTIDRNDFRVTEEVAKHIIFAAYWTSDEVHHEEGGQDMVDLDIRDLFHLNNAELEFMKYLNDPEHYNSDPNDKQAWATHPPGWSNVGTVTHEERRSIRINGYVFSKMIEQDLWLIQGDTWHWPRPAPYTDITDFLYSSPDEIMKVYPEMYISFLPSINIRDYLEDNTELSEPQAGEGLDDVDEFEIDDPEADLQRMDDAERAAASAARDMLLEKFSRIDLPGVELLFVGAKGAREGYLNATPVLRPFVIVGGKKPVTEGVLDDKDEFDAGGMCYFCNAYPVASWVTTEDTPHDIAESLDDKDEFDNGRCTWADCEDMTLDYPSYHDAHVNAFQAANKAVMGKSYVMGPEWMKVFDDSMADMGWINVGGATMRFRRDPRRAAFDKNPFAEARQPVPPIATFLNRWVIKPNPIPGADKPTQTIPDALDDVDIFAGNSGCNKRGGWNITFLDKDGNDVTYRLETAFQEFGVHVAQSPNWSEYHNFEEFEGQLSTRPELKGPECVVWVDAKQGDDYTEAWYHPGRGEWISVR